MRADFAIIEFLFLEFRILVCLTCIKQGWKKKLHTKLKYGAVHNYSSVFLNECELINYMVITACMVRFHVDVILSMKFIIAVALMPGILCG